MSEAIDILVCVDADSIVNRYNLSKNYNNPTRLDKNSKYLYYITGNGNVYAPGNNATAWTDVKTDTGSIIRWRPTSLTQQFEYTVLLYNMEGTAISKGLIDSPFMYSGDITIPYLASDNEETISTTYKPDNVRQYYHQTTAEKSGKGSCIWSMMIYKRETFKGYISHEFPIEIK
ncbi:AidA/PixA family protein [Photorhabdus australis]|uniref:AidA/PixA family protein n=1 Tax=Photorhabdus australis TaxID=286156 RepID=UPI00068A8230|nr:AidA/PixA family protein [Photorhabdus australis]